VLGLGQYFLKATQAIIAILESKPYLCQYDRYFLAFSDTTRNGCQKTRSKDCDWAIGLF